MVDTLSEKSVVRAIAYHLPEGVLTNEEIIREHPDWSVEKIYEKTGIRSRHIAAPDETASDLAAQAAEKLFASGACTPDQIDCLLFCTQTPDYALPSSACILQHRLGIPTDCAALDYNLGCSGYVYGLSLAKAMLESGQRKRVLLLTGETYSKWIDPQDRSVRTIFGDAGTASLIELGGEAEQIGPFVYGTDGRGEDRLIVPNSGARKRENVVPEGHDPNYLFMDGAEIFTFTIRSVPKAVRALLTKAEMTVDDVDLVVFHQANTFMLNHLRQRCRIPEDKFVIDLDTYGNTVSNTIPIALANLAESNRLQPGQRVMLVGFGVGYSWSACMIQWPM